MPDRDDDFPDVEFFDDPPERPARRGRRDPEPEPPATPEPAPEALGDAADEPFSLGDPEGETGAADRPPGRGRSRSRSKGAKRRASGGRGGGRSRSGGGGRSRGGAGGGAATILQQPAARLALGALAVGVLILVLVLVVRECQRNQLEDSYKTYMNEVGTLVDESAEQGKQLRVTLTNASGDNPAQLRTKVVAIRDEAQSVVDRAEALDPPGQISGAQQGLVTSFEYRVNGLATLADNLEETVQTRDADRAAALIANPMQRFLASDVIYQDQFLLPSQQALKDDSIDGVMPPPLKPFLPNAGFASSNGARALLPGLRRQRPADQDGGDDASGALRGTSLVKTEALPSGTRLTPGSVTTVQASEELKWRITVENGGDFVENGVTVRASLSYPDDPGDPQVQETSIDSIAPGDQVAVEIPGPSAPKFGDQGTLEIEIEPVENETRVDNNRAEYPVTITI